MSSLWRPLGRGVALSLLSAAWARPSFAAPAAGDDIRDIRPLISIPPFWYWCAAAAAAALVIAALWFGIRYWKGRAGAALTPKEQAERALLRAEALARAGSSREWAEVVAPALRGALAARLGRDACPETTNELRAVDWAAVPHGDTVDGARLLELLSTCDLARFALARLDAHTLLAETQAARAWVSALFEPSELRERTPSATAAPSHSETAEVNP